MSYKTKIDAYINASTNKTQWMTMEKKEFSNTNGLHFVSKRIHLRKKLGGPVFLLLETE